MARTYLFETMKDFLLNPIIEPNRLIQLKYARCKHQTKSNSQRSDSLSKALIFAGRPNPVLSFLAQNFSLLRFTRFYIFL